MGCLKRLFALVLLIALVGASLLYRGRIEAFWNQVRGHVDPLLPQPETASPELAEQAERKLAELATGERSRIALGESEVQSLIQYRYRALLPAFADSPRIELEQDRLRLRVRVPIDKLPRVADLGEAVAFLPDTADFAITGQILPLDSGRVALAVDEVVAASIPLPDRLVPGALNRLGRRDEPGLPPDAVAVPLPPGAGAAYVRSDSLVFLSGAAARPDS